MTLPHSLLGPPTRNFAMAWGPSWMLMPLARFRLGLILGGALSESSEELRSSKCPDKLEYTKTTKKRDHLVSNFCTITVLLHNVVLYHYYIETRILLLFFLNKRQKITWFDPWRTRVNEADNLGVAVHHCEGPGSLSFSIAVIHFNFL